MSAFDTIMGFDKQPQEGGSAYEGDSSMLGGKARPPMRAIDRILTSRTMQQQIAAKRADAAKQGGEESGVTDSSGEATSRDSTMVRSGAMGDPNQAPLQGQRPINAASADPLALLATYQRLKGYF